MPTYFARKAGNINAADVWATAPSGTAAAVTFASGDVLMANSFAITVNVSNDLGLTGQIRTDNANGATTGGSFTMSAGVTLTSSVFAGTSTCLVISNSNCTLLSDTIRGGTANASFGVSITGSNATITASSILGGSSSFTSGISVGNNALISSTLINGGSLTNCPGLSVLSPCTINCPSITGGSGTNNAAGITIDATIAANAVVTVTGNFTGGSNAAAPGLLNISTTARVNLTGICTGGSVAVGASNASTGVIAATRARGNAYGPGNTGGLTAQVGIANSGLGTIEIEALEYGTFGQSPTNGTGIRLKKASSNVTIFNYCDTAGAKTLIDATQNAAMPAASNVRSGVSYASGALTGSCAVPVAGSVALGVPVDATTGTALLTGADVAAAVWSAASRTITEGGITAADVWSAASRTLTTSNGPTAVDIRQEMDSNSTKLATLTNAPSVPSAASIRAEIDSNSTQLAAIKAKTDALPASPAATGDIPSANITAIKLKTDALVTDRLAQCSTVSTTGAQLAAALS